MDAPRIQYAKTADGVDIAFAVYGAGEPTLVVTPNVMNSHLQLEWDNAHVSSFLRRLSRRLRVVRYDPRGLGMSQRDVVDFSSDAGERDLQAVVDRAGIERFAIYQHVVGAQGPLAFAVHHPERAVGVFYWVGQTLAISPETRRHHDAIAGLMDTDWGLYTQIVARLIWGWDSPNATPHAVMTRAAASPAAYRAALRAVLATRNSTLPAALSVPTLISHLAGADDSANVARQLASTIPGAHILAVPGTPSTLMPFVYDTEIATTAIADFVESLFDVGPSPKGPPELKLSAMRAILFTDVEAHTPLMQRLGDDRGREVMRTHEQITRHALAQHGGTEVKTMGDAFMAWFPSAQQALSCGVAIQRAFASRNASAPEPLNVRVGINAGEPVAEDNDLFGNAVIAAARICHEAAGGQIVVSDVVRQLVAGKGFVFSERPAVQLKGFGESLRLFDVDWQPLPG